MSGPENQSLVFLTAERLAELWRLPVEDAVVICGSGCQVEQAVVDEWVTAEGSVDKSIDHCSRVSSVPIKTLHGWRKQGLLQVRALGAGRTNKLLVAPSELVRVLRKFAAARNGTLEVPETPTQTSRRFDRERLAAIEACGG